MYITILLRIAFFASLSLMVFDFLRVEQLFIQMDRGFIDGFSTNIIQWPGYIFIIIAVLLLLANIVQVIRVKKNKNSILSAFTTPEYDVSDERTVLNTQKAVSYAFSVILIYSVLMIGSYMLIPNYFVDYVWYPLFTTASIPVVGLLVYLITYKILARK